MLIGTRTFRGWAYYIGFLIRIQAFRFVHAINPDWHKWEYRSAPDCGCCGDEQMRCYACWTFVPLDKVPGRR